jgi:hypothetical protein
LPSIWFGLRGSWCFDVYIVYFAFLLHFLHTHLNHLLVYSLVQTKFLVAYVSVWQITLSQIVVALVEIMSSEFIWLF